VGRLGLEIGNSQLSPWQLVTGKRRLETGYWLPATTFLQLATENAVNRNVYFRILIHIQLATQNQNIESGNRSILPVLGHPAGLFVLFFTEMWERFSYYGMRALLVLFLVSDLAAGGWGWPREEALKLYGLYTGLVYVTPILGGILADQLLGYRKAVILGAILMTLGHASMAFETKFFFYMGLTLLILGNGAFKPNISSIVGQLYPNNSDKKDAGYTIFYMGINAGAFLGILLCGYIGEKVGWSYGFGLAGIFMFFGMLQFYFGQKILENIGLSPKNQIPVTAIADEHNLAPDMAVTQANNDIMEAMSGTEKQKLVSKRVSLWLWIFGLLFALLFYVTDSPVFAFLVGAMIAVNGYTLTDPTLTKQEKDRVWVIVILSFFTIFFWMAFEQAGGSMTIFAKDYTNNVLTGGQAGAFKIMNTLLTVIPLLIITWVLVLLARQIAKIYPLAILFISLSFLIIWGIAIWMLVKEGNSDVAAVPASWYGILNSFFIIAFAPVFSKLWETKINPSGPIKFALGLILLGVGFGVLAYGGKDIPQGAQTASVSMIWLILAYLFHTLGELCLSPVGLSYISKLAPVKLVGLMFGVWFGATAIANYLAGWTGSLIDKITAQYSISTFFMIYTLLPIAAGLILIAITRMVKKLMHGIS
jgi:proton-dependent oligopeptide transporter, POT family